jgi:hypothetical protein
MTELDAMIGEHLTDQQPAVTVVRLGLAAHKRDPMVVTAAYQALYGLPKRRLLGHAVIAGSTLLVVVLFPRGPAAQLVSEEEVAGTCSAQSRLHAIAIELLGEARVGV